MKFKTSLTLTLRKNIEYQIFWKKFWKIFDPKISFLRQKLRLDQI